MKDANPCPKCGHNEPEIIDVAEHQYTHTSKYFVACKNVKCQHVGKTSPTREGAVRLWNEMMEDE